jgi:hypothetical protein
MRVVMDKPPMFDEIRAAFNLTGRSVIFAWGDTIYNPYGGKITPELFAHEAVHGERQGSDVEGWWRRYIVDPQFRLAEEIPAHIVEYQTLLANAGHNRAARRKYLGYVARRLCSPLYGSLIGLDLAKEQLKRAERSLREAA